jgi:hypothetical protein
MAQYRLSSQVIGRGTGRSAVAAAAYRSGQSLADERTGLVHDYSKRRGVAHTEIMAPDNAPDWMRDRVQLWNAVEAVERRKDAQLSRELQLSLPHELTDEQRRELVRGFVREQFVNRGMIADIAIHRPDEKGDERNHHAHIMLTMRELTKDGFGNKARAWNDKALLETWREQWAIVQNRELERNGQTARVDHRSFETRGIDREPQSHLGPSANQMERRGEPSRIANENREAERLNVQRAANHQAAALVHIEIERHRREHAALTAERIHALQDAQLVSAIDLDRKHHRQSLNLSADLDRQYGQAERTMKADLQAAESRLAATGWRKLLRKVTGAENRDRERAAGIAATIASIEWRKREAADTLRHRQEAETAALKREQSRRVELAKANLAAAGRLKEQEIMAAKKAVLEQRIVAVELRGAQERPAPASWPANQTEKPVKRDYEKARDPKPDAAPAPTKTAFISYPAPAPAPKGETPRPSQKEAREIPEKPAPTAQPNPAPARDWREKAPQQQEPPQQGQEPQRRGIAERLQERRDWREKAAQQQEARQERQPLKQDWERTAAAAPPASQEQDTKTRRDWREAAEGKEPSRSIAERLEERRKERQERPADRSQDRDFERER